MQRFYRALARRQRDIDTAFLTVRHVSVQCLHCVETITVYRDVKLFTPQDHRSNFFQPNAITTGVLNTYGQENLILSRKRYEIGQ